MSFKLLYVRRITRSTLHEKAPFCLPGKISSVACGFSPIISFSDYPKTDSCKFHDFLSESLYD